MRKCVRIAASTIALAVMSSLAPLGAHADNNCASNLVIFSHVTTPAGVERTPNNNALWCAVDPGDPDTRLINPGSDGVAVRLIMDLGEAVPVLAAVLDGLGFDHKQIELKRSPGTLGTFLYDSAVIPLPAGAAASGCITASAYDAVSDPDFLEAIDSNTFHTIDVQATGC